MSRKLRAERLEQRTLLAAYFSPAPTVLPVFSPLTAETRVAPAIEDIAHVLEDDFPELNEPDPGGETAEAPLTNADTFKLHSKPGSNFTVFLDFDGSITENTGWNTRTGIPTLIDIAYDRNGDPSSFNNSELSQIRGIWKVVAEDFAPFDVNVTTEDPGIDALTKTGGGDADWGIRSLHSSNTNGVCSGCGGIAYVGSFTSSKDVPAYSFNKGVSAGGNTQSHEVGHTVRLGHDGLSGGTSYYAGHGSGNTSWGPIMGGPGSRKLKTWSNGDYYNASNMQDDLDRITTLNGFSYRDDDHGNTFAVATPLDIESTTDFSAFGIISQNNDVDLFSFETVAGNVSFNINPYTAHPNLDIWAGIYDSTGSLIAESNLSNNVSASLSDIAVGAGKYFLKIDGVGTHGYYNEDLDKVFDPGEEDYTGPETTIPWAEPGPTGYSDYASLGQYWITGTRPAATTDLIDIQPVASSNAEGDSGSTPFTFEVSRTGDSDPELTVAYSVATVVPEADNNNYAYTVDGNDFVGGSLPDGIVTIPAGEVSATLTIDVVGDTEFERDEHFRVILHDPTAGWTISESTAPATILSDETAVGIASLNTAHSTQDEGGPGAGAIYTYTLVRYGDTTGTTTADWQLDFSGFSDPASSADFVATAGQVTFDPGVTEIDVEVTVNGDLQVESDESFKIAVTSVNGANVALVHQASESRRGIIFNDDVPDVSSVAVNDGSAQRSAVKEIHVSFTDLVNAPASAFEVTEIGTPEEPVEDPVTDLVITPDHSTGVTVVTIGLISGESLADGNYQLNVEGSLITSQFDGSTMPADFVFGDEANDNFYRKYGDHNGNRLVDLLDFTEFRRTFDLTDSDPDFLDWFDFDYDGRIGLIDFTNFRRNFGT